MGQSYNMLALTRRFTLLSHHFNLAAMSQINTPSEDGYRVLYNMMSLVFQTLFYGLIAQSYQSLCLTLHTRHIRGTNPIFRAYPPVSLICLVCEIDKLIIDRA